MAKLLLSDIANLNNPSSATATMNANYAKIEESIENTLSRDGLFPNQMEANLDMNSHRILNLPFPIGDLEPVRKKDLQDILVTPPPTEVLDGEVTKLDSIDELRALTSGSGATLVFLTSYYAGLYKGGGWFYLSSDTTSADDSFLIIKDFSNRRWKRLLTELGPDVYMAGAKGDCVIASSTIVSGTDDTAAFNKIFDYVRVNISTPVSSVTVAGNFGPGLFRCSGSINGANIETPTGRWFIHGNGCVIVSDAAGKIALDMTASRFGELSNLTVYGDSVNRPAVGIAIGRTANNNSAEAFDFFRVNCTGHYIYAGFFNGASEGFFGQHCAFANASPQSTTTKFYGAAMDSSNFLRYEMPVTPVSFSTTNPMVITTSVAHGLVDGDKVFITGTLDSLGNPILTINRKWTIDRTGDNTFTVPVSGSTYASGGQYFKQKFGSDYVTDFQDTLDPYTGDGFGGGQLQMCSCSAGRGFAAILETSGGFHRYLSHCLSGIQDDIHTADIPITSTVSATNTFNVPAHGLSIGNVIHAREIDPVNSNDKRFFKVLTTPSGDSFTVSALDGASIVVADGGASGVVHKQTDHDGYAVHFVYAPTGQEGAFLQIHHEKGVANEPRAWGYVQSLTALRTGIPTSMNFAAAEIREHAAGGVEGFIKIDPDTITDFSFNDRLLIHRIKANFGNNTHVGKLFVGIDPTLIKIRGNHVLGQGMDTIAPGIDIQGTVLDTFNNNYVLADFPAPTGLTTLSEHFLGTIVDPNKWNFLESSGASHTLSQGNGGSCHIITGNSGTDMNANGIVFQSALNWRASGNTTLNIVARSLSPVTDMCLFIGFTNTISAAGNLRMPFTLGAGNTLTSNAADAVGFLYDTAADTDSFWLVGVKANVDAIHQNISNAPVDGSPSTFEINLSPLGEATFKIGGTQVGTKMLNAVSLNANLTPIVAVFSRLNGVAKTVAIGKISLEMGN